MIDKRVRLAIISSAIISVALILIGVVTVMFRSGKTEVNIVVYPQDATITINSQPASTGTNYLEPGEYTFKATKSGWKEESITQKIGSDPTTISLAPDPDTTEAYEWMDNNIQSALEREAIVGQKKNQEGNEIYQKNPFILDLPYKDGNYEITYNETDKSPSGIEVLIIAPSPETRSLALNSLRKLGYDPSDMYIRYVGFNNPLQGVN